MLAWDHVNAQLRSLTIEGRLDMHWVTREQFDELDIIDTTRPVLPLLADDLRRDPDGRAPVALGAAVHAGGTAHVVWGTAA